MSNAAIRFNESKDGMIINHLEYRNVRNSFRVQYHGVDRRNTELNRLMTYSTLYKDDGSPTDMMRMIDAQMAITMTMCNIAQAMIYDFCEEVKGSRDDTYRTKNNISKNYYKQAGKQACNKLFNVIETYNRNFSINQYKDCVYYLVGSTDYFEEHTKNHLERLYRSIRNELFKHNVMDTELFTELGVCILVLHSAMALYDNTVKHYPIVKDVLAWMREDMQRMSNLLVQLKEGMGMIDGNGKRLVLSSIILTSQAVREATENYCEVIYDSDFLVGMSNEAMAFIEANGLEKINEHRRAECGRVCQSLRKLRQACIVG